jgi:hypothetical protein
MMQIINSTANDLETIFQFYDFAIAYQKTKFNKHWQGFDLPVIEKEINENRQFKIVADNKIVCVFAITFNDPAIWGEKDKDPAVYTQDCYPSFISWEWLRKEYSGLGS